MTRRHIFSSESVSAGHPDKMADSISDAILDAILAQDCQARVACETLIKTGLVVVAGEITTQAQIDYIQTVRDTIIDIGYDDENIGFDGRNCEVLLALDRQSADIRQGVDEGSGIDLDQGAGDQGLMFGFACSETDEFMPMPIQIAHDLIKQQNAVRQADCLTWLRPDAKSQVSILYEGHRALELDTIVLSTQHDDGIDYDTIREGVMEEIIKPILPKGMVTRNTSFLINPTGRFVIGGPAADCGLTGRKIIVDTYGGMGRHGGGAFSGKDPSKVDRSAAYAARYIAKNIVAAGLAEICEVQLAYAIGVAEPVSLNINTFGTATIDEAKIERIIPDLFDLRPKGIIKMLDLLRPIYRKTATNGHFGRVDPDFTWEKTDKVEAIRLESQRAVA